jgi:hypothetical protein
VALGGDALGNRRAARKPLVAGRGSPMRVLPNTTIACSMPAAASSSSALL